MNYWQALGSQADIIHVVSVSSGVPSALTAIKVIERYGHDKVRLVFADTKAEDEDNYRFLQDVEAYCQHPIEYIGLGKTPLEVMREQKVIFTQRFAPCTRILKLEPIRQYVQALQADGAFVIMHIGYDLLDEKRGRLVKTTRNWLQAGCLPSYPLVFAGIESPIDAIKALGIKPPRTYGMGFKHANCIGIGGCVKFGQLDMVKVLELFPERFEYRAATEAFIRDTYDRDYAHVRDMRDERGYITLYELKDRYEAAQAEPQQLQLFTLDADLSGCSVECGVTDSWLAEGDKA